MIAELSNHLWQSTLFAAAAGLLAFAFRKNRAQVRYWLWLSSSLKFLIPFSLLMAFGSHLGWAPGTKKIVTQAVSFTMVQVTQPFPKTLSFAPPAPRTADWSLIAVLGVWACGFVAIVLMRFGTWLRIRAAVRSSTRLEVQAEVPAEVQVHSSPGLLEPGVVGLFRPVLLLPEGILERLTPPQLEAVLAHELCHVRRRDNLTAAIHMIVEAVFWFHPLVWWIGVELVKERERACDEEVLRLGSEALVYAEGILSVCKFYMESPLTCVAGVTGHNLRKRVELIVRNHVGAPLSAGRRFFLATAGALAFALPLIVGIVCNPLVRAQVPDWQKAAGGKMEFEVASIRQKTSEKFTPPNFPLSPDDSYVPTGGLLSADFSLLTYIDFAYKLHPSPEERESMVAHLPKWVTADRFEIHARAAGQNPTKDQMRLMMQSLLADRFKLAVHFETQQMPLLALKLVKPGKLGPKLRPHADGPPCDVSLNAPDHAPAASAPDVFPPICDAYMLEGHPGRNLLGSRNTTMPLIAESLPSVGQLSRPVQDQTGLSGRYDFTLEWTPEANNPAPPGANVQPDLQGTTFLEALREQLGLKLESQKGPVEILVIDHVEKPSEN